MRPACERAQSTPRRGQLRRVAQVFTSGVFVVPTRFPIAAARRRLLRPLRRSFACAAPMRRLPTGQGYELGPLSPPQLGDDVVRCHIR
jgi:hypothetical protein